MHVVDQLDDCDCNRKTQRTEKSVRVVFGSIVENQTSNIFLFFFPKKVQFYMLSELAELLPDTLVRIVENYVFCQKCNNEPEEGSNLCQRCLHFSWCLYEFSVVLPTQSRQLGTPVLYRLEKPKKGYVRLQCAMYETFFYRFRNPFITSSVNRFHIVQTRCHSEKYVFDHAKHVRNLTFMYYCGASLLTASILLFPRHKAGLIRASRVFAWTFTTASLYSLYKIYNIETR